MENSRAIGEISESIENGIKALRESKKYKDYLRVMGKFHTYSLNNNILIFSQMPSASLVAGYSQWIKDFGRQVQKGEKAIKIIAPKISVEKVPVEIEKADGTKETVMEERKIPRFGVTSVFDISQTKGKDLPQMVENLSGKVWEYEKMMDAIKKASPVPISIGEISNGADGVFSVADQTITIKNGMSEPQTISAAIHEIAHATVHNTAHPEYGGDIVPVNKKPEIQEIEAESVSYTVCSYFGIDTSKNSFAYINEWINKSDMKALRESLETIKNASGKIIEDIKEKLLEHSLKKEETAEKSFSQCAYKIMKNPASKYGHMDESMLCKCEKEGNESSFWKIVDVITVGRKSETESLKAAIENGLDGPYARSLGNYKSDRVFRLDKNTLMTLEGIDESQNFAFTVYKGNELKLDSGGITSFEKGDLTGKDKFYEAAEIIKKELGIEKSYIKEESRTFFEDIKKESIESLKKTEIGRKVLNKNPLEKSLMEIQEEKKDKNYCFSGDEKDVPDYSVKREKLWKEGYLKNDIYPLSKTRAEEFFTQNVEILLVKKDHPIKRAENIIEMDGWNGVFGIKKDVWKDVKEKFPSMEDKLISREIENHFFENVKKKDSLCIYQKNVRDKEDLIAKSPSDKYFAKYTATFDSKEFESKLLAQNIFDRFKKAVPTGYIGRKVGDGDVISIVKDKTRRDFLIVGGKAVEISDFKKSGEIIRNKDIKPEILKIPFERSDEKQACEKRR